MRAGQTRQLNVVLPIERGSQTFFIAGDSLGGISVFFRNGTMRGRVRVTEDPGGVKGLIRAQGQQQVLFYSSHAFGFFSPSQVDLQRLCVDIPDFNSLFLFYTGGCNALR